MVALVKIEVVVDLDNLKFNWTLVVLNAFGWDVLHFNAHNALDINLKKSSVEWILYGLEYLRGRSIFNEQSY